MMYDYTCQKCGGLVPEPMKAYCYSGQFCHCDNPVPPPHPPEETKEGIVATNVFRAYELGRQEGRQELLTELIEMLEQDNKRMIESFGSLTVFRSDIAANNKVIARLTSYQTKPKEI